MPGDKEIAKRTITFLENRRVIFGEFRLHVDHEEDCLRSANEIRSFLTEQIDAARSEELKASLRAMRAAARKFADAAESHLDTISFGKALGDFRTLMGVQIARIAIQYDLEIEDDLAAILPPRDEDDLEWIPGFKSN